MSIVALHTDLNLSSYESVMVINEEEWAAPDYTNMSVEEILHGEDTKPMFNAPTMEECNSEREKQFMLDRLCDIQGRMTKGMGLIRELNTIRTHALYTYIKNKDAFKALMARLEYFQNEYDKKRPEEKKMASQRFFYWKRALWAKANPIKKARDNAYQTFQDQEIKDKLTKYWARWVDLRNQANEIAVEYNLWGEYMTLLNGEINTYFTNEADMDESYDSRHSSTDEIFADTHIKEMYEYSREVDVDWSFHDQRIQSRREYENADMDSLLASAPF